MLICPIVFLCLFINVYETEAPTTTNFPIVTSPTITDVVTSPISMGKLFIK